MYIVFPFARSLCSFPRWGSVSSWFAAGRFARVVIVTAPLMIPYSSAKPTCIPKAPMQLFDHGFQYLQCSDTTSPVTFLPLDKVEEQHPSRGLNGYFEQYPNLKSLT